MVCFKTSRHNGRTNADVIYELVFGKAPSTVFRYKELLEALNSGTDTQYDRQALSSIIARVNKRLLQSSQRTMRVVRGVGYRIAEAKEHAEIASLHKRSGDRKYRKAVQTINQCRTDEMTPAEKERYDAMVTVMNAHTNKIDGHERRLRRLEEALSNRAANANGAA